LEARVGLVLRRYFGFWVAFATRAASRSRASWRLRSWLLKRLAWMITMPAAVMRFPARVLSRAQTFAGSPLGSYRSWTAVATLLTCCPPGPEARTKSYEISFSWMVMSGVICIIGPFYASSAVSTNTLFAPLQCLACINIGVPYRIRPVVIDMFRWRFLNK